MTFRHLATAAMRAWLSASDVSSASAPASGRRGAGCFLTALAYYSGVLEPAFTSKFMKVFVPRGTAGWVDSDEAMTFVNARIAAQPYIAGETFTAADVSMPAPLLCSWTRPCCVRRRPKHSRTTWRAASRDRPAHGLRQRTRILFEPRSETAGHSRRRYAGVMQKGYFGGSGKRPRGSSHQSRLPRRQCRGRAARTDPSPNNRAAD
jgi:hypothetical protein